MEHKVHPGHTPYGEIQGFANGVPAYSNLHDGHFSGVRSIDKDNKIMTGFKYQCVEFARRWLLERKGLYLTDVNWAASVFERDFVENIEDGSKVRMVAIPNDGINKPVVDAFLIYPRLMGVADWGHIAVITEVSDTFCRIADQNQHFHHWEGAHYSAELHFAQEIGPNGETLEFLEDKLGGADWRPLGWMIFPDTPNRDPSAPLRWAEKYTLPETDKIRLASNTKSVSEEDLSRPWLNLENLAEKKYVECHGMAFGRTIPSGKEATNSLKYYVCNDELMMRFYVATNEMHRAFMRATDDAIASDEFLRKLGIPDELWPNLRHSWESQPHSIAARLNFAVDDCDNVKCLSYDADVFTSLLECGRIQEKLSRNFGLASDDSWGSGWDMETKLVCAWRRALNHIKKATRTDAKVCVHFCQGESDSDHYTALYAMEMAEKVGAETKLCASLEEFHFTDEGKIADKEGKPVVAVWKSSPWELVFADFEEGRAERGSSWHPGPGSPVRLSDLLLDPEIYPFEPIWKAVTAHKALLSSVFEKNPSTPFAPPTLDMGTKFLSDGKAHKTIVADGGAKETVCLTEAPPDIYGQVVLGSWVIGGEAAGITLAENGDTNGNAVLRISFDGEMVKALEATQKN